LRTSLAFISRFFYHLFLLLPQFSNCSLLTAMDLLLPIPARLTTFSRASVCTISPANPFNSNSLTYRRVRTRVNPVRVVTNSNFNSRDSNNCEVNCEDDDIEEADGLKNVWEETEFVEVFGIGSRKDALLEFCLASPSLSPALRFWYAFWIINFRLLYFFPDYC